MATKTDETAPATKSEPFYTKAAEYWSDIPPTIDGMLGGFGFISQTDVQGSKTLLKQLFHSKSPPGKEYALDCGAGIGRISKHLLTDVFEKVDLVEQNSKFLEQAREYLGPKIDKVGAFYDVGLQNFVPEVAKYDVIWMQWVVGHLTDSDLVTFLQNCVSGLKPNGVIIVKENITSTNETEKDDQDSSVTRPISLFKTIFKVAKLDCYRTMKQPHFPKSIFPVYMFALRPENPTQDSENCDISSKNEPE